MPQVDESHTAIALPSTFTQCSSWSLRSSRDRAFQEGIQPSHVPSSSSTPTKLLGETPHSGHEQHYDMVNQRLLADSEYISPDEKKVTQHCESDKSTTPMTDLGAQTPSITSGVTRCQGGTTASASLLPNVIAEALNSRSMNASSLSCSTNTPAFIQPIPKSHASASDVYSSNCSKMGHFIDHEQISRNMGFNMNHSTTSTGNGHPNSRDQSDNPKNALTQPSLIIGNNEMSQMTHQDARTFTFLLWRDLTDCLSRTQSLLTRRHRHYCLAARSTLQPMVSPTDCNKTCKDIQVVKAPRPCQYPSKKCLQQMLN